MNKISIVVPVYNVKESYLTKCLESIIHQTMKEIEIILVDDGSSNDSLKICNKFAEKDKRIIIIQQKNQGVSVARNNGIKISNSEYIMFVDSDDWLEKDACERLYKYKDENVDVIIGRNYVYREDKNEREEAFFRGGKINEIKNKYEIYNILLTDRKSNKYIYLATPWAKLYRSSLLKENNTCFEKNIKIGEDMLFNLDAVVLAKKIFIADELIYNYRKHNNNTENRLKSEFKENLENTYDKLEEKCKKNKLNLVREINYYKIRGLNSIMDYCKDINTSIKEIKKITNEAVYKDAIRNIETNMLSKKRKLLVLFARIRFYLGIKLLYKIKR